MQNGEVIEEGSNFMLKYLISPKMEFNHLNHRFSIVVLIGYDIGRVGLLDTKACYGL